MEVFRALIGSQNYGLATPKSDKDYYIYCCPTFEDLYNNTNLTKEVKHENGIYFYKDVRSLSNLIKKASFNQLEILWSEEVYVPSYLGQKFYNALKEIRDEIPIANLPRLYSSTLGELNRRLNDIEKDKYTEGTKYLFDKYGYDTKNAMHAFRLIYMLDRMYGSDENLGDIFKQTPNVCSENKDKTKFLDIKNGNLTKSEIIQSLNRQIEEISFNSWFKEQPVNHELQKYLDNLIYELVKNYSLERNFQ